MRQKRRFETEVIHAGIRPDEWQGATLPPIFLSAAHAHPTAESLSETFAGRTDEHIYGRLSNPTNRALEEKLALLEGGAGALATASGMAAVSCACLALARAGDEIVAPRELFFSTYLLFKNILPRYGITARLADDARPASLAAQVTDRTRFVYLETIANPGLDVPDVRAVADMAHARGLPVVIDNTLASPYLCRPVELGADVVLHSTTKYLSGHGSALGGVIVDAGRFDWSSSRFPDFAPNVDRKGPLAFLDKVWRDVFINFGPTPSPFSSFLTMLGLDTLALRLERHQENAAALARFLQSRPEVAWVNHPSLPERPAHAVAARQFAGRGYGAMLTFGLADAAACRRFIDGLELVSNLANLGDCKTLIIHPRSTQLVSCDDETCRALGVPGDLLRLSVGVEAVEDIQDDLAQALAKATA